MESYKETLRLSIASEKPNGNGYYYAELELPAAEMEIQDALHRLRLLNHPDMALDISIESCPLLPGLSELWLKDPTLPELNFFARRLNALPEETKLLLRGVFQHRMDDGKYSGNIGMKELINLTYGLDSVMIASNVGSDEALGQFVMDNDLNDDISEIPESSRYLLDRRQIGKMQRQNEGGVFVDGCYVVAGDYELPEVYDGRHLPIEFEESEDAVFRLLVGKAPENDPEETIGDARWISLPISKDEAGRVAAEVGEASIEECVYFEMESAIPRIQEGIFGDMKKFSLLNQIASVYAGMAESDQIVFKAALQAEPFLNLEKAFDIAAHLPEYELSYGSRDSDDFYQEYLSRHLDTRFDRAWLEHIVPHPDSGKLLARLGATETDYGVVSAHGQSLYRLVSYEEEPVRELTAQTLTDERLEVVEVLGQTALFTNGRVTEPELPEGLYRYDLREGETMSFATVERKVTVNHGGTILTKAPLDFGGLDYIAFDEDTSPNFLGYDMTLAEFLQADFTEAEDETEQPFTQDGGMQLS